MSKRTAVIRKLVIANVLITLMFASSGIFFLTKAQSVDPEPAATETAETTETDSATVETDPPVEETDPVPVEPIPAIPGKIETLSAVPGTLSATLSWEDPAESASSYSVEYGTVAGGVFDQICTTEECVDAVPGATVTDLLQDTEYMFRITPSNAVGTGEVSNTVTLTSSGPCSDMDPTEFCGRQVITTPTLRFTSIPTSFDFPPISIYDTQPEITEETTQETSKTPPLGFIETAKAQSFYDIPGTGTFPSITISSNPQNVYNNSNPTTQPALEDLLGIQDNRNSGGFEVQVQTSGTFTDGTNTIPLTNLFVATSVSSPVYSVPATDTAYPCPATNCGVIYGTSVTERGILAPADSEGLGLGMPGTFPANFGGSAIVLMDGGLPSTKGRNGYMYQFMNYYLQVPAFQAAGNYAVKLTFTLIDDTI